MNRERKTEIKDSLKNWTTFHPIVAALSMEEVEFAIDFETKTANRNSFINRLNKRRRRLLVEKVREDNNT